MKTYLIRAAMAALGMFLCAVVGAFAIPLTSRDYSLHARTAAILILLLAVVLRRAARWRVLDFIAGLLAAEAVTLIIIGHFSGYAWLDLFHSYNLRWLRDMNLFIVPPWLLGFGLGSLWLWLSEKYARSTT
jgi:hypothetical protein